MSGRSKIADYLDVSLLARLPNLEFRAGFLVDGFLSGMHASPFRGGNVEFKEHRKYHPGDDISDIDWKAYARTDRLHIRIHEDDTNLNAHILLDRSASMNFRGPLATMDKWDYARSIAAALLLFLLRQKDASALTLVGGDADFSGPPATTDLHFRRQLERLAVNADSRECNWNSVLAELEKEIRPRSIVILISDFYTEPRSLAEPFDRLRAKACELLLFHIIDPAETDFSGTETLLLQDNETGERLALTPELIRENYREQFREHITALTELVRSRAGDYLMLKTDRVPLDLFGAYLNLRAKRRKRR